MNLEAQASFDFRNKVALVTGSSKGIGLSIARAFYNSGARIVMNSRNPHNLDCAVGSLQSTDEQRVLGIPGDVRDDMFVASMVKDAVEKFGRIDILVNNAGGNFSAPLEDISPKGWRSVVDLNLTSVFYCSKACLPVFQRNGQGVIVNIGSVAAFGAHPGKAHYGAAKAGVVALTMTMAYEWAKYGVRVNCVAPGPVLTEASPWKNDHLRDQAVEAIPLQRVGLPEEVAPAVLFLSSDSAGYITGETLRISGGRHKAV